MRQRSDGNEINACLRNRANILKRNTAGGFDFYPAHNLFDSFLHFSSCEVVQHDPLYAFTLKRFHHFMKGLCLDLDSPIKAFGLQKRHTTLDRVANSTCRHDVVVFDEHHIVEPEAMVRTAAEAHSPLVEHAQPRDCLSGIRDLRLSACDCIHVLTCEGCNAAHPLKKIECRPFAPQ